MEKRIVARGKREGKRERNEKNEKREKRECYIESLLTSLDFLTTFNNNP